MVRPDPPRVVVEGKDRSCSAVTHRILCGYLPLAVLIVLLTLFVFAIALDIKNNDDRFEEELEFTALVFLAMPASFVFLGCGVFLYFTCEQMDRGCFVGPKSKEWHNKATEVSPRFMRGLEWMDFVSDVVSSVIIYSDFNNTWRGIIIFSLVTTLVLNLSLVMFHEDDHTWKGRRRRLALSFAILGAEDVIMVPLSILYLREEVVAGSLSELQEGVERAAVGASTGIGVLLLLLRFFGLMYHISCALPDKPLSEVGVDEIAGIGNKARKIKDMEDDLPTSFDDNAEPAFVPSTPKKTEEAFMESFNKQVTTTSVEF